MNNIRTTLISCGREAAAQSTPEIPPAITTPDKVETRTGTLEFKDGAPSAETIAKVYDKLDFTHAFEAFVNTMRGVSIEAICKGMLDVGVKENEVLVFSELMDAKSLFLTANADTIYFLAISTCRRGPWCSRCGPRRSALSTTTGSAGSPISVRPGLTGAKGGNT